MITLSNFKRDTTITGIRLSCAADIDGKIELIFFDIDGPEDKLAQITPDPSSFLIGMLIAAMERGEDLHIEGNLPETFLHHVNTFLVPFLIACKPNRHRIYVTAKTINEWPNKVKDLGAMTGLSCGVDSMYTVMEYTKDDLPPAYKLKSIAVFDVGAFGENIDKVYLGRRAQTEQRAREIVRDIGCDYYMVKSNLEQWQQVPFHSIVSILNCACALSLADICATYMPASSAPYADVNVAGQRSKRAGIDNVDPILLPLISSSRLEIFSSGGGTDRFRKTLALIDRSPYLDKITTCTRINPFVDGGKNCGTCTKCGQLLLIAESK